MIIDNATIKKQYAAANRKRVLWILAFVLITSLLFFLTLGFGVYKISIIDAIGVFFNHLFGNYVDPRDDMYVWDTRLPRAIGAIVVGAGLSIAGAIMQNDFKNPLAEPYTMGISSGAFLGATLGIIMNISIIPFVPEGSEVVVNAVLVDTSWDHSLHFKIQEAYSHEYDSYGNRCHVPF